MKHKLIVTVVASALELYAATATAQANSCLLAGTSNSATAATPTTSGPLSPRDGFPEYVTDSTGFSVQRCIDDPFCFYNPIVTTDSYSLQIGSGGEAFYWGADGLLTLADGTPILKLTMAAETAFLQTGPLGEPINGSQLAFLRLRWVLNSPVLGQSVTYYLTHPYGEEKILVDAPTGKRDSVVTVDRGFAPNQSGIHGPVGPFLRQVNPPAPAGYAGDINTLATVTPGPCGAQLTLRGESADGSPIEFEPGVYALTTNQFAVQGKVWDKTVQTPINSSRLTYSRALTGQIDAFGSSLPTATFTVKDGPVIPTGTSRIATAKALDHATVTSASIDGQPGSDTGLNSTSVLVADGSRMPPVLALTASDPSIITDPVTGLVVPKFDPTTQNLPLVDFVDISSAEFDPSTNTLTIAATSGDQLAKPKLTVRDLGAIGARTGIYSIVTKAPPGVVYVDSANGGSANALVSVAIATLPAAPSKLVSTAVRASSVDLAWTDGSDNETEFRVYQVNPPLAAPVATSTANSPKVTVSNLNPGTSYTFKVVAANNKGESLPTNDLTLTTISLPAAPTSAAVVESTDTVRTLKVSWVENVADKTGFAVYRKTGNTSFAKIADVGPNVTSYDDVGVSLSTTYTYQIRSVRNGDESVNNPSSNSKLTNSNTNTFTIQTAGRAAPTLDRNGPTTTFNSVTLSWTDNASNEDRYVIRRCSFVAPATTCADYKVVGTSPAVARGTSTYTDSTVAPRTSYRYQVSAFKWVNEELSTTGTVTTPARPIANVTSLKATADAAPVLSWLDTQDFETGYRVGRKAITFNATSGASTVPGAFTAVTPDLPINSFSYTDTAAAANSLYQYQVVTLGGAETTGASTGVAVYAVAGGIPQVTVGTATRPNVGNATAQSVVTVRWTANTAPSVGGYRIERCTVTTQQNCLGTTGWTTATSVNGRNSTSATNALPSNTAGITYRYRVFATTGGLTTGIESTPSASASVTR